MLSEQQRLKINLDGKALERAERIDEAITLYEYGVTNGTDTPHTYDRLMILYRKARRLEDERRICELAVKQWPTARDGFGNVTPSSYSSRLTKIDALLAKKGERGASLYKDGQK